MFPICANAADAEQTVRNQVKHARVIESGLTAWAMHIWSLQLGDDIKDANRMGPALIEFPHSEIRQACAKVRVAFAALDMVFQPRAETRELTLKCARSTADGLGLFA